jgi:hypothetical protein
MDAWVENTQYAPIDNEPLSLAAALRSVADQVVPEESEPSEQPFADLNDRWPTWYANKKTRRKLLAIATELEGHG